jgi:hypothetical protein
MNMYINNEHNTVMHTVLKVLLINSHIHIIVHFEQINSYRKLSVLQTVKTVVV